MIKTLVILGSGGHTSEMIRLLDELDSERYLSNLVYIIAESDTTSLPRVEEHNIMKAKTTPTRLDGSSSSSSSYEVYRLPRAREVHQSYLSSIHTTLRSLLSTYILLRNIQPDLIIANGPGTCVPVLYVAFVLRWVSYFISFVFPLSLTSKTTTLSSFRQCKMIFVESVCRVKTLSLSGKLVYHIVDLFIVHWPYLIENGYPCAQLSNVFIRPNRVDNNGNDKGSSLGDESY
jgi:beta-1,4-N-acetylglucosaminyltransferase